MIRIASRRWAVALSLLALAGTVGCAGNRERPRASEKPGRPPSEIFADRPLNQPPPLDGVQDVGRFLEWAGRSVPSERETARQRIHAAAANDDIVRALIEEVEESRESDLGRAILVLSILGEMRSPIGERFLKEFVDRPLPETGTEAHGEIVERTAQILLQAKAVDGLAYLLTPSGDAEVLRLVSEHPALAVRAEAVRAYLWNHEGSSAAKETLRQFARQGEEILLERVPRVPGEQAETFNAKLAAFLAAHPEVVPPPPVKADQPREDRDDEPQFEERPPPPF